LFKEEIEIVGGQDILCILDAKATLHVFVVVYNIQ
jgi:hypothetical protein